jgi:hypothetical protein
MEVPGLWTATGMRLVCCDDCKRRMVAELRLGA